MHDILKFHIVRWTLVLAFKSRQERYLNWKGIEMKIPNNQQSDTPAWPIFSPFSLLFCQIWSPSLATPDWNAAHSESKKEEQEQSLDWHFIFLSSDRTKVCFYYFRFTCCGLLLALPSMRNEIIKNWNLFATLLSGSIDDCRLSRLLGWFGVVLSWGLHQFN